MLVLTACALAYLIWWLSQPHEMRLTAIHRLSGLNYETSACWGVLPDGPLMYKNVKNIGHLTFYRWDGTIHYQLAFPVYVGHQFIGLAFSPNLQYMAASYVKNGQRQLFAWCEGRLTTALQPPLVSGWPAIQITDNGLILYSDMRQRQLLLYLENHLLGRWTPPALSGNNRQSYYSPLLTPDGQSFLLTTPTSINVFHLDTGSSTQIKPLFILSESLSTPEPPYPILMNIAPITSDNYIMVPPQKPGTGVCYPRA